MYVQVYSHQDTNRGMKHVIMGDHSVLGPHLGISATCTVYMYHIDVGPFYPMASYLLCK